MIHLSFQKKDSSPISHWDAYQAVKVSVARVSLIIGKPVHDLFMPDLRSHSHRIRRIRPCFLRPKPPKRIGLHMLSQATKHFPPLTSYFPAKNKAHTNLFSSSRSHAVASGIRRWCTGLAAMTDLITFPPLRPCHAAKKGCTPGTCRGPVATQPWSWAIRQVATRDI